MMEAEVALKTQQFHAQSEPLIAARRRALVVLVAALVGKAPDQFPSVL
jgi:hypothetical protein